MFPYAVLGGLAKRPDGGPPTMAGLAGLLRLDRTTLAHDLRPLERDGSAAVVVDAARAALGRLRASLAAPAPPTQAAPAAERD